MSTRELTHDSLTRSIESIQETIKRYGDNIGADETRTRDDLIKPLLYALGWNSPSVITPEYIVSFRKFPFRNTRVDYALHQPDKRGDLITFVEAKKMRDDLTAEHRRQVFEYANSREVSICILTNGDQWDLYEVGTGSYRLTTRLSIRTQPASECARLLLTYFPKPPGFETAGTASPPQASAADPDPIPTSGWASRVAVSKVLTWLAISFITLSILGWAIGLSIDQPISNVFAALGLIVMLGLLIVAVIVFRRSLPPVVPKTISALRRQLFAPISGDRRETGTWVAIAMSCGSGFGLLLGYLLGYAMADFITEFLIISAIVGITGILISFLIFLILLVCLDLFLGKEKKHQ